MARVERLEALLNTLRAKAAAAQDVSVTVGYSANYSIHVHEDLEARHKVGQAKFLETPARELSGSGELARIVREAAQAGKSLAQGLLLAGLRLQRESQLLCPVDTGALRSSASTRME